MVLQKFWNVLTHLTLISNKKESNKIQLNFALMFYLMQNITEPNIMLNGSI